MRSMASTPSNAIPKWNPKVLINAVQNSDIKTLRWFFDRGCPSDVELNENKDTPLLLACRLGLSDVCRLLLLEYQARNDPHPHHGHTALQLAVSAGHESIVQLILDCAAPSKLDQVIVNHIDANGEAPIHVASRCGSNSILYHLIVHGANVATLDARGRTSLHLASQQGHVECLLFLLEVGADEFLEVRDDDGWKCLDLAIRASNIECCRILLQSGARVSPHSIELGSRNPKIQKLLLEYITEDGSIGTYDDESSSSSDSCGGNIFNGLNTYIASPEMKQFQTPMSKIEDIEELETPLQFSHSDESWTVHFTEEGDRYFYNTVRDYSTWDDPRLRTQSINELLPRPPRVLVHLSPGDVHTIKEVRIDATPVSKSESEKEIVHKQPEVISPVNVLTSDPKSNLLAQIKLRRNKEAPSFSPTTDMKPNNEDSEVKTPDPKSILLAQIRKRGIKSASPRDAEQQQLQTSIEPTREAPQLSQGSVNTIKEECINPSPIVKSQTEEEANDVTSPSPVEAVPNDPKSILLAQIRSRRDKAAVQMKENNSEVKAIDSNTALLPQMRVPDHNAMISAIDSSEPVQIDADPNLVLHKYSKMKNYGVPLPAILQRMSRDGVDDTVIQMFQQKVTQADALQPPRAIETNEAVNASLSKSPAQKIEDISKDKTMLKYAQMVKVGVPAAAVVMKMTQDNISEEQISKFRSAYGLDPPGACTPKSKQPPAPPHRRPSKTLQKVHWNTINEEKLHNSLWTMSASIDADISQKEVEQLESLFSASPRPSAKTAIGRRKGSRNAKSISAMVVEPKRANNIAISLAQYKAFKNFDDLVIAVASLDESNLNAEKVSNMAALLPTASEMNQLKKLDGQLDGLGRAELFFVSVAKMPRFKEKLFSFRYLLQFDEQMNTLKTNLLVLETACTEVINSKNLAFVCKKLLNIGNCLNNQSEKGATLNSLLKIARKKGNGKISVIDHLMSSIDNTDSVCFQNDIPTLRECSRLDLEEMRLTLREMESGLESINNTIKAEQTMDERHQHSVNCLARLIPFQERAAHELKAMNDLIARVILQVESLQRFFAEDPSSSSAAIFTSLLEFSCVIETSKEAHHRKQQALRRKASLQRHVRL